MSAFAIRSAVDLLSQVDFSRFPGLYDLIPFAQLEGAADCEDGIHSWINETGLLPADTACTRCGEKYGDAA